jgi:hypothetical protein
MDKQEAYKAMKEGKKLTHKYFGVNEYIYLLNGQITTEDGYNYTSEFKKPNSWNMTGWEIMQ